MSFLQPEPENKLEKDYAEPFRMWQAKPDKVNTGNLLRAIEPEIRRGVFAHVGGDNPLIKSRARQMAIQSLKSYDPTKAKLGTHVVNSLQGLKRVNRKQTEIISVPERLMYDRRQIERMSQEIEDEIGRAPSAAEIADRTGFSVKRINKALNMQMALSEGTYTRNMPESANNIAVNPTQSSNWAEVLYYDLDPTSQKIMEWTMGMNGSQVLSNKDIARRLRITPGAVTQRKQRIQQQLDSLQDLGGQY